MEKSIVFDTGSIISLTSNNLLWLLKPLKQRFQGNFYITFQAKNELIDRPLEIKRFEFEALQVLQYFNNSTLVLAEDKRIYELSKKIYSLANELIIAKGRSIQLISSADAECLAATVVLEAKALAVDERTIRMLVEDIQRIRKAMRHKLRTSIDVNAASEKELRTIFKPIKIIRSFELVTVAYKLGFLDKFLPKLPNAKKILLDSVLWGVKTDGCSVSEKEIRQILKTES